MPERGQMRRYRFGDFVLDEGRCALQRNGEDLPLRRKSWEVLRELLKHPGELLTKEALLDAVWRDRVVTEAVVAKSVREIRQVLGDGDRSVVSLVPRRGYRFDGLVSVEEIDQEMPGEFAESLSPSNADPLAAAALEGSGASPPEPGAATDPAPLLRVTRLSRPVAIAAVLLAAVAIVFGVAREPFDSSSRGADGGHLDPSARSIAVLPFEDMSPDGDQQYLADGMAEEILNQLARIPRLRVISRSSSFAFRGKEISGPDVARQLNVAYVLEGSVRRFGRQLRVTAQLVEAGSGTYLWSEAYDRPAEHLFQIQDDISAMIVRELETNLGLDDRDLPRSLPAVDPVAHEAYLLGRHLVSQRTQSSIEAAIAEFERAIEIQHDYALAHAELALSYTLGYLPISREEADAMAAPHVATALALDPGLAEAHAAAGRLAASTDIDLAIRHYSKALEINPNYADVYTWMAHILDFLLGRYAEAFEARKRAVEIDPLSIPAVANYIDELLERELFDEAEAQLDKLARLAPDIAEVGRGIMKSMGGHWARLALGALEGMRIDGRAEWEFVEALALLGLDDEIFRIDDEPGDGVLSLLGRHDEAAATALALLDEQPDRFDRIAVAGLTLASAGRIEESAPYLEQAWKGFEGRVASQDGSGQVIALAAARRATGAPLQTAELSAAVRNNAERMREAGMTGVDWSMSADYEAGLAAYLEGDLDRAIELIGKAVDAGFFLPSHENLMPDLYGDDRFAAVVSIHEERRERERRAFLDVVCSDNPYADVWQPLDETCER